MLETNESNSESDNQPVEQSYNSWKMRVKKELMNIDLGSSDFENQKANWRILISSAESLMDIVERKLKMNTANSVRNEWKLIL